MFSKTGNTKTDDKRTVKYVKSISISVSLSFRKSCCTDKKHVSIYNLSTINNATFSSCKGKGLIAQSCRLSTYKCSFLKVGIVQLSDHLDTLLKTMRYGGLVGKVLQGTMQ